MNPTQRQPMAEAEYLLLMRDSEHRYDFIDGQIYNRAGGKRAHQRISGDLYAALHNRLLETNCEVFNGDQAVKMGRTKNYVFPDASVSCGQAEFQEDYIDVLLNPVVVFEVLSPSTAKYDLTKKARLYQMIDSLRAIIYIDQDEALITILQRGQDSWAGPNYVLGLEAELPLSVLDTMIPLAEIYRRVSFDQLPSDQDQTLD